MRKIKIYFFVSFFIFENLAIAFHYFSDHIKNGLDKNISGVYRLSSLRAQDSQDFKPMDGVEILKIFSDGVWISPAYDKETKKVVSLSGGHYVFDSKNRSIVEEVLFNMKDLNSIGLKTTYRLSLNEDGFYQSGIYKEGTKDAWKVEEQWVKKIASSKK